MSTPSDIFDLKALLAHVERGYRPKLLLFWGHRGPANVAGPHVLSQWWPAPFQVDGVHYPTAEHFMMASKARLFGDAAACDRVLAARSPGAAKAAGRTVERFHEATWTAHRFEIVVAASVAKFDQNPALGQYLRETGNKVLVEASPVDRIWGIGLARDDEAAQNPRQWQGLNLLGFALMKARAQLAESHRGATG
jgi:ribA/ribD-fused uncharacterized protein